MNTFLNYIYSHYTFNSRLLSVGRILISIILLFDLLFRFQNFEAHYTNAGVLPTSIIKEYYPFYQYYFSLHNIFDSYVQQKCLFFIHFLIVSFLLVGYKTRVFTILNFIFLLSLHHRNPLILQGGDDLLRLTIFYMIYLPWNRFYSLDAYLTNRKQNNYSSSNNEFSWMFVVFYFNIAFVYLFSAFLKTADEWRVSGEAIYYALSLETLRLGLGHWTYSHPLLMKFATFFVYYVQEIIAPIFLILSINSFIRNVSLFLIILLHLFIVTHLKVGIFPFVGITTAIMLLNLHQQNRIIITKFSKISFYFSLLIFILILRFNLATLNTNYFTITLLEDRILNSIGLSQRWNMFSPGVKRYDGHLVLRGIKSDNTEWDIIHNSSKIHYEKTTQNFNYLKGDRWRKFLENYEQTQYNFIKSYFCYYLIRQWNSKHPDNTIEALNILYMKKITLPGYQFKNELENLCLCNPAIDKLTISEN
ncbi:MAG: hypothetical protein KatS3mg027_1154 [Bacteroidia bacterium]|nr:MAG: hypothetical protein KatS3mg027_1154 [Bacteroidia bacterium]